MKNDLVGWMVEIEMLFFKISIFIAILINKYKALYSFKQYIIFYTCI